jgi:23S rRNA pseudouridine1911/1915/1917 synthase
MKITAKNEGILSELLIKAFGTASKSMIKKIVLHGSVTVNGIPVSFPGMKLKTGDVVEYVKYKPAAGTADSPFPVIFEDDSLLVVHKPAGILTHAEKGTTGTSLYKEMLEFIRERSKGKERIYVVHRLDREVSGIVLFVKNEKVKESVTAEWRNTTKRYWALVHGSPAKPDGTIESWLVEAADQKMYVVKQWKEGAKKAITHYKTIRKVDNTTLLEIELETGKKNQIRVHLAEIGCPIVGDWRYGAKDKVKRKVRLHAFYFSMKHPVTGVQLEFNLRMPRGFLTLGDKEEKYN